MVGDGIDDGRLKRYLSIKKATTYLLLLSFEWSMSMCVSLDMRAIQSVSFASSDFKISKSVLHYL